MPLSVYSTFVLEEKHGFNKTTASLFVIDLLKGWGIAFVLGSPFLAAFLYIFKWAGERFVPWLMGFMYVFSNIAYHVTTDTQWHQSTVGSRFSLSWL